MIVTTIRTCISLVILSNLNYEYSKVDNTNLEIQAPYNQYWVDSYGSTFFTKEKKACIKTHVCQNRSFEFDVWKSRKSSAQSLQSCAERRICIGRLMCFPPRPCHCFHVTTAWQPGKWDTGREKKGRGWIFSLEEKNWQNPTFWYPHPPVVVAQWWRSKNSVTVQK